MEPVLSAGTKDFAISNRRTDLQHIVEHDFIGSDGFIKEGITTYEAIVAKANLSGFHEKDLKILELTAHFEENSQGNEIMADLFQINGQDYIKFNVEWSVNLQANERGASFKFKQALYTTVKLPEKAEDIDAALKMAYEGARCYTLSQKQITSSKTVQNGQQIEELKHQGTIFFKPKSDPVKVTGPKIENPPIARFKATFFHGSAMSGSAAKIKGFSFPISQQPPKVILKSSLATRRIAPQELQVKVRKIPPAVQTDEQLEKFKKAKKDLIDLRETAFLIFKNDKTKNKEPLTTLNESLLIFKKEIEKSTLETRKKNEFIQFVSETSKAIQQRLLANSPLHQKFAAIKAKFIPELTSLIGSLDEKEILNASDQEKLNQMKAKLNVFLKGVYESKLTDEQKIYFFNFIEPNLDLLDGLLKKEVKP